MMSEQEPKDHVLDCAAVQQRTAAYTEGGNSIFRDIKTQEKGTRPIMPESRDVIIAFRITRSLAEKIDCYKTQHRRKSRTEAIVILLETALHVMENAQRLEDPALVKYFRENLYNVQLVDDVAEWPQDRIEAIIGVLASEREMRFRLKLGRH
jgi:hypothetical protein